MKRYLKQLASESVIYGVSGVITSFIGMFLMPIYTSVFQPSDYGIIALISTTSTLISMFIIFGFDNAVSLWYWDKPNEQDRRKTISCWYFFLLTLSLIAGLCFTIFPAFFSKLILNSSVYANLFLIFGFNIFFSGFQKVANIWFRIRRKPVMAVSYSLFLALLTIALNVLFVLYLDWGLKGIYYSQLIASVCGFIITTLILQSWISLKHVDSRFLREMIKFSLPLIPAALVFWLMSSASSYFINLYIKDKTEVGLYQVGATIASVLSLATWAFLQAWPPFALSIHREANATRIYSVVLEIFVVAGLFCAFCLLIFAPEILYIFTNANYSNARNVIGLLAINTIILGIPGILSIANNIKKKNSPYAVSVILGAAVTMILFSILIPRYGKEGAALAMISGNLVIAVYLGINAQKLLYVPYEVKRILTVCIVQATIFFLLWRYVENTILKIVCTILILLILLFTYYRRWNKGVQSTVVHTER